MSKATELQRLLNNTPSPGHADARIRLAGFVDAIEPFEQRHVQRAVTMILNCEVPEINPSFSIFPPMLVSVCRQLRDREITRQVATKGAILQIEQREEIFHEDPPMLRKMAVQEHLARALVVTKPGLTPDQISEQQQATAAHLAKHDGYFHHGDTPEAMRKRLKI